MKSGKPQLGDVVVHGAHFVTTSLPSSSSSSFSSFSAHPVAASTATAGLVEFVVTRLGRPLDSTEVGLLALLTPQGIAKLNHDVFNGVSMSETLEDFKVVHANMQKRRKFMQSILKNEAKQMIRRMGRNPTTDELALFVNVPIAEIRADVRRRTSRGDTFEGAIEDLAVECKFQQLATDAAEFARAERLQTQMNFLVPTIRPSTPEGLAPTMAQVEESGKKALVGMSPIVSWFYDGTITQVQSPRLPESSLKGTAFVTAHHPHNHHLHHQHRGSNAGLRTTSLSNLQPPSHNDNEPLRRTSSQQPVGFQQQQQLTPRRGSQFRPAPPPRRQIRAGSVASQSSSVSTNSTLATPDPSNPASPTSETPNVTSTTSITTTSTTSTTEPTSVLKKRLSTCSSASSSSLSSSASSSSSTNPLHFQANRPTALALPTTTTTTTPTSNSNPNPQPRGPSSKLRVSFRASPPSEIQSSHSSSLTSPISPHAKNKKAALDEELPQLLEFKFGSKTASSQELSQDTPGPSSQGGSSSSTQDISVSGISEEATSPLGSRKSSVCSVDAFVSAVATTKSSNNASSSTTEGVGDQARSVSFMVPHPPSGLPDKPRNQSLPSLPKLQLFKPYRAPDGIFNRKRISL